MRHVVVREVIMYKFFRLVHHIHDRKSIQAINMTGSEFLFRVITAGLLTLSMHWVTKSLTIQYSSLKNE